MLLCAGDKEIFPRLNPESNNNKWKKKSEILNFIKVTNQKAIKKMNIQTTDCKKYCPKFSLTENLHTVPVKNTSNSQLKW